MHQGLMNLPLIVGDVENRPISRSLRKRVEAMQAMQWCAESNAQVCRSDAMVSGSD